MNWKKRFFLHQTSRGVSDLVGNLLLLLACFIGWQVAGEVLSFPVGVWGVRAVVGAFGVVALANLLALAWGQRP